MLSGASGETEYVVTSDEKEASGECAVAAPSSLDDVVLSNMLVVLSFVPDDIDIVVPSCDAVRLVALEKNEVPNALGDPIFSVADVDTTLPNNLDDVLL